MSQIERMQRLCLDPATHKESLRGQLAEAIETLKKMRVRLIEIKVTAEAAGQDYPVVTAINDILTLAKAALDDDVPAHSR